MRYSRQRPGQRPARRGQAAIEYILIFAFVLAILIPLIVLFVNRSSDVTAEVTSRQVQSVGQAIVDRAESVYYLGEPSKATVRVFLPEGIDSVNLTGRELVFRLRTVGGPSDIVISSAVNLSGTIKRTGGIHFITIENKGTYVQINST
jgi:hypothetical protein